MDASYLFIDMKASYLFTDIADINFYNYLLEEK